MAAAAISFDLKEIDAVKKLLANAALDSADRGRLLHSIGEEMVEQTRERFETKKSPEGDTWKSIAEKTRRYYERATGFAPKPPLVLTGELRHSITSEVQGGAWAVLVGAAKEYAAIHQWGGEIRPKSAPALFVPGYGRLQKATIPARPYLGVSQDDMKAIEAVAAAFLAGSVQ
jgi:phage virion morphogenesis protein